VRPRARATDFTRGTRCQMDTMPNAEGLGIYESRSPLFAKLTKLQSPIANPLDRCFLDFFFANT